MDRHRERLLAKPASHCVDIVACFNEKRADGVTKAMKCEAVANLSCSFESSHRLDETRIEAALGPWRGVPRRSDGDSIVVRRSGEDLSQIWMNWNRQLLTCLIRSAPNSPLANRALLERQYVAFAKTSEHRQRHR